jgi:hypothetical protein
MLWFRPEPKEEKQKTKRMLLYMFFGTFWYDNIIYAAEKNSN